MQNNLKIIAQRWQQLRLTLPYKVGVVAVAFSNQRFREQSWVDIITEPWKRRKPGAKRNTGRAILVDKGRLRRGNRIINADSAGMKVTIGNDTPYAKAQNDGFRGLVTIPEHKRKRLAKEKVFTGELTKKGRKRSRTVTKVTGEIIVKAHTRRMNLPRRRFMGPSMHLNKQIGRLITMEINKIFKP